MINDASNPESSIPPRLGLWDAVSIIVGIVVGTSIFRTPAMIFDKANGPWAAMGLWLVGGLLAWCGAVCYAELATTYPRDGGDYEYLNRAFGRWCGFLFAWGQLTVVISGNIAIMAYAFADYAVRLWPASTPHAFWLTIAPIVALSAMNALGVVAGKVTQNILTAVKIFGLVLLVLACLKAGAARAGSVPVFSVEHKYGLALVFVLYAYGGWAHAAYVAAEVRDQRRNLPRALVVSIALITLLYLVINAAYLAALGYEGVRLSKTPAADAVDASGFPFGFQAMCALVMVSALGAINGMVLTGSRIYAVWGGDYPALAWLGHWKRTSVAPIAAIVVQAIIAILLVALVGTAAGRNSFDATLHTVGIAGLPWGDFSSGFETLIAGSAPAFWALCLLTGLAVFVLRACDHNAVRPFSMPLYPLPAVAFCATCSYMLYASAVYARWLSLIGIVPLVVGFVVWIAVRPRQLGHGR